MLEKFKKLRSRIPLNNIELIINIALLIIIIAGVLVSIHMLLVNRTLQVDEADFAISMTNRNLFNLTFGPFERTQIAPIIYIYLVKFIITILGNSEMTLRLLSVFAYVATLVLSYKVSKDVFKNKYPLFPVAFIASIPFVLKYSNEFKPYMFDCVMCLLTIFLYYLYNQKKIRLRNLVIVFAVIVWASNPACFIIGGILSCEFLMALQDKNYKQVKKIAIGIGAVILSFGVYYLYWLRPVATSPSMQGFWTEFRFPLIPTSVEDFKKMNELLEIILKQLGQFKILIAILAVSSILIGTLKNDKYRTSIALSIGLMLCASYVYMFPIENRMWTFIYPILTLLAFDALNMLFRKDVTKNIIALVVCSTLVLTNEGIILYSRDESVYYNKQEANLLMDYLEENIEEDEKIYVYYYAKGAFEYRNGYGKRTFGKYNNEVILGDQEFLDKLYVLRPDKERLSGIQVDKVINEDKIYIIAMHYTENSDYDMRDLTKKGYLELLYEPYYTPLYYYVQDVKNMKTKVEYSIANAKIENGRYMLTFKVLNTGKTIIGHRFEDIYVACKDDPSVRFQVVRQIKPEYSFRITFDLDFSEKDEIELQLYSQNNYWFDELGIEPLKVTKDMFTEVEEQQEV